MYQAWVGLGLVLAFVATRRHPPLDPDERARQGWITLAAVVGAAVGAHGLAALAAWRRWIDAAHEVAPLGGRTVLGGLLGGWLAVEAMKWRLGVRAATGDRFALPLALALTCGRIGCWSAGCCGGRACGADELWPPLTRVGADGVARLPVQAIEAAFHALAAVSVLVAERRGALTGRRLAAYLTVYAGLRFVLEFARDHPPIALGLTWFQWLALALGALAAATWWRRSRPSAR